MHESPDPLIPVNDLCCRMAVVNIQFTIDLLGIVIAVCSKKKKNPGCRRRRQFQNLQFSGDELGEQRITGNFRPKNIDLCFRDPCRIKIIFRDKGNLAPEDMDQIGN